MIHHLGSVMPTELSDYVIFVALLLAVLGAGLLRVGLMDRKSDPRGGLFIVLGIAFGIAAVLILVLRVV
jgi:hypothetical protein